MDNHHHSVGGFLQLLLDANPQIGHAIQTFVRGLTHQHQSPPTHEPSLPDDDPDLADVPPLEPVSVGSTSLRERPVDRQMTPVEDVARSDQARATPHDMPASASSSAALSQRNQSPDYESDGSMPSLQTVSDADSDVDMHDVEMRLDSQESHRHPQSSRRARVDDDIDEEDMRETNRQRVHSPIPTNDEPQALSRGAQQPHAAPAPPDAHEQNAPPNPQPPYSRLIYTFDIFPPPPPHAPQQDGVQGDAQADAEQDQHHPHDHWHAPPMFNFTFQIPIPPPGATGNADANDAGNNVPPMMPDFAQQFFGMSPGGEGMFFPFFPFPFGMPREEEQDDPERAERLIRGLEEVPSGLVQRMERVGTEEGDSLCSICWEKLSTEGGGFEEELQSQANQSEDNNLTGGEALMDVDHSSPASSSTAEGSLSAEAPSAPEKDLPKVVALPCSHVFHTACLLPWFTKPHRTTCPSCRFDIDPESLTYVPPRQRRSQRPRQRQAPASAQPLTVAQPVDAYAASSPAPNTAAIVPHGQDEGHPLRAGLPPMIPLEFSLFFPIMQPLPGTPTAGAGAASRTAPDATAGQAPPDGQVHQGFFERLFGGGPHHRAQPQPEPDSQPQPNINAGGATPFVQNVPSGAGIPAGYMRLDEQTARNLLQNIFGGISNLRPQATANAAGVPSAGQAASTAGPVPQRPANATGTRAQGCPRPPEKRQWTLPPPPGPTLHQRVERKEREHGLRCWDVSCGLGPSDDDPCPVVDPSAIRQIAIRPLDGSGDNVCEHTFHPSCLVSAERVAGWGGEDKKEEKEGEAVEVSCPICRAVGMISQTDWDEGACALV